MLKCLALATRLHAAKHGAERRSLPRLLARSLLVALLAISVGLALTACEGGYTTSNERTTESHLGDHGQVEVSISSADGSITKSVEIQYADAIMMVDVTLEVEEGTFKLEFLGEEGQVTLALEAGAGEQVSGRGYMVTDSFGEGEYRVTAEGAKGVHYTISYQVR